MNKVPEYTLRASRAYFDRMKAKGWVRVQVFIPAEIKDKVLAYREQLIAELEATSQEAK